MPDSSTKTIRRPSRWAFFKAGPSAALPAAHGVFVTFDGALLGFLRTEAQRTQDSPDLCLAEAHTMQALDDGTHALECPYLSAKSIFGRTAQKSCPHRRQLLLIELGWAAPFSDGAQGIDAAFIKQPFPRIYRLPCRAHCLGYVCAAFAREQHPACLQSLLRCFAQPFFHHDNILQ